MIHSSLNSRSTKAVIPAAGMGTRFLPATKAMPKEMLPVVDEPAIQYVVAEAKAAGLDDVLMITGRSKRALEDHFDRVPALEHTLELKGDFAKLEKVQKATNLGNIHFVRQNDALGLGHAVLCAKQHVGHEPFAVLLGDDLIDERENLLDLMLDVQVLAQGEGDGFGVHAVVFSGKRYDTGDKLSYLKAVIELSCAREDLGPALRPWLKDFAAELSEQ